MTSFSTLQIHYVYVIYLFINLKTKQWNWWNVILFMSIKGLFSNYEKDDEILEIFYTEDILSSFHVSIVKMQCLLHIKDMLYDP